MNTIFENAAKKNTPPFRYDIVGSFLRPQALKEARKKFAEGEITAAELRAAEDREITALVEKEKAVGLHAVTDGEFRRSWWHLDFLWNLCGVEKTYGVHGPIAFKGSDPRTETIKISGKVDFDGHPFLKDFEYLKKAAGDRVAKFTVPSPSMLHLIAAVRNEDYRPVDIYRDDAALLHDIGAAYKKAVRAFYDAGCRYLQLDDTSWGELCSPEKRESYKKRGIDLDKLAKSYVAMVNAAIADRPDDMTVTMHICRGNFRSTWFSSGGYEPVAETLFGGCKVDGFFLEYDSDRAGDFKPLRFIKDQNVVLGLVTSKSGLLEKKEDIVGRIEEAAKYVDINKLCLSPQCGFSSTEEGNILTEEQQWNKLAFIKEIADEVWSH